MNSHNQSASSLEASLLSSSPETLVVASKPMPASTIICDPANGMHMPDCRCTEQHLRLNRTA